MTAPQRQSEGKPGLLVVDDDPLITDTLAFALGTDYEVYACESRLHAVELLRQLPSPPPLALVDLGLPPVPHSPEEGFQLIADLLAHSPRMKIFVLSGQNDAANARHARALGAWEFIAKPSDPALLKRSLARALELPPAEQLELVGTSAALAKLKSQIAQFAASPYSVLIEGESGSGKELAAASLHRLSPRAARPYLTLNCAAIAPTLVEPTLFGYVKGAFTGASANKSGYFEDAQDGTLLLDEIGELPLELQSKLLRVLENGEYQRVGETQTRVSRARIVAATNRDLRAEVAHARFRSDLYHRLSVFELTVPPLRELGEDKVRLLDYYRALYADKTGSRPFAFDEKARARWLAYPFPGNVRELKNIVIRLTTKYAGYTVGEAELEPEFAPSMTEARLDPAAQARAELLSGKPFSLDAVLKSVEQTYVDAALEIAQGNMTQAAKLLGVSRGTLYGRLEAAGRSGKLTASDSAETRGG